MVHSILTGEGATCPEGSDVIEAEGCRSFVRPCLRSTLQRLCTRVDLAVFSMGIRSYVESIIHALDPDGLLFGDRILTREDANPHKYIPERWGTSETVVVVDDSPDAWPQTTSVLAVQRYWGGDDDCVMVSVVSHLEASLRVYESGEEPAMSFSDCCWMIAGEPPNFSMTHGRAGLARITWCFASHPQEQTTAVDVPFIPLSEPIDEDDDQRLSTDTPGIGPDAAPEPRPIQVPDWIECAERQPEVVDDRMDEGPRFFGEWDGEPITQIGGLCQDVPRDRGEDACGCLAPCDAVVCVSPGGQSTNDEGDRQHDNLRSSPADASAQRDGPGPRVVCVSRHWLRGSIDHAHLRATAPAGLPAAVLKAFHLCMTQ
jgi:hypothetical protein